MRIIKLQFRENSYFNEIDQFLYYDAGLEKFFVSRVHLHNGSYYATDRIQYKLTSVKSINCKEL